MPILRTGIKRCRRSKNPRWAKLTFLARWAKIATLDYSIGGGHVVERGGQWIGNTQTEILALAEELGVDNFPSYTHGKTVLYMNGTRFFRDDIQNNPAASAAKYQLDQMALTVPLNAPWTAAQAAEWDALSVADWLTGNVREVDARQSIEAEIQSFLPAPTQDISLLYFLFYVHSAGGLQALNSGAQELRFKGGPQALSQKMAQLLEDDLVLGSPVSKIIQTAAAVKVVSRRACITAKHVVVAMMPADIQRIRFSPALPQQRRLLNAQWQGVAGFKVNVVYAKPFWRAQGLSGFAVSDDGPVPTTFDNSPPDASRGVLLGFVEQQAAPADAAMRRQSILNAWSVKGSDSLIFHHKTPSISDLRRESTSLTPCCNRRIPRGRSPRPDRTSSNNSSPSAPQSSERHACRNVGLTAQARTHGPAASSRQRRSIVAPKTTSLQRHVGCS